MVELSSETPQSVEQTIDYAHAIEPIDRELDFYRKRSGQVYVLALTAEALIVAGRYSINLVDGKTGVEHGPPWRAPLVLTLAFLAVAVVGTVLGAEYRRRIHVLKASRDSLFQKAFKQAAYPSTTLRRVSEIQVLYFVLWFTSVGGSIIAWLRFSPNDLWIGALAFVYAAVFAFVAIWAMWLSFK